MSTDRRNLPRQTVVELDIRLRLEVIGEFDAEDVFSIFHAPRDTHGWVTYGYLKEGATMKETMKPRVTDRDVTMNQ